MSIDSAALDWLLPALSSAIAVMSFWVWRAYSPNRWFRTRRRGSLSTVAEACGPQSQTESAAAEAFWRIREVPLSDLVDDPALEIHVRALLAELAKRTEADRRE